MDKEQEQRPAKAIPKQQSASIKAKKPIPKPTPSGRPHWLTITFSVIALLLTGVTVYWNIAQPDIRYVSTLGPETAKVVESKMDAGNFVHSLRLRPTFTNYSLKPGFIDKAELVPLSIATLPEVKVTSINKTFIYWHQPKQIEITFLISVPTDPLNHLNTTRELSVEEVLAVFDNTGKKVDHLTDGMFGRIKFNLKDIVKVEAEMISGNPH